MTQPPRPLDALDDRVLVEHGVFGLMDLDVSACPRPWPQEPLGSDAVTALRNRVDLPSGALHHEVLVRLEAWAGRPPAVDPESAEVEEIEIALTSGRVRLWTVTMGPSDRIFTLAAGGRYRLRAACRGSAAALAHYLRQGRVPDGTERWLLQFWPIGGVDRSPGSRASEAPIRRRLPTARS